VGRSCVPKRPKRELVTLTTKLMLMTAEDLPNLGVRPTRRKQEQPLMTEGAETEALLLST
jgi:hypothetical protein